LVRIALIIYNHPVISKHPTGETEDNGEKPMSR